MLRKIPLAVTFIVAAGSISACTVYEKGKAAYKKARPAIQSVADKGCELKFADNPDHAGLCKAARKVTSGVIDKRKGK